MMVLSLLARLQVVLLVLTALIIVTGVSLAAAQVGQVDRLEREVEQIDRTITAIERQLATTTLQIEHRLTKLETLTESSRTLLLSIASAVILQVISAGLGWLRVLRRQ